MKNQTILGKLRSQTILMHISLFFRQTKNETRIYRELLRHHIRKGVSGKFHMRNILKKFIFEKEEIQKYCVYIY